MPKQGYFTVNTETDFCLTKFSKLTKHTKGCKMISFSPKTNAPLYCLLKIAFQKHFKDVLLRKNQFIIIIIIIYNLIKCPIETDWIIIIIIIFFLIIWYFFDII